ncbi:MAG: hypothetical protein ACMXYF_05235 [Candidatus Woesearchaeota archaeon]
MRIFILRLKQGVTTPDFSRSDPVNAGHLEIACHCIMNSLWVGGSIRQDSIIHIVLEGPPTPPVVLTVQGKELDSLHYAEVFLLKAIQESLKAVKKLKWLEVNQGPITCQKQSFEGLIKEYHANEASIYYLHPKGELLEEQTIDLNQQIVCVLGDHKGMPNKSEKFLKSKATRITLGSTMLFASQCVTIVHNILDKKYY